MKARKLELVDEVLEDLQWFTQAQLFCHVVRGDKRLVVAVQPVPPNGWQAMALETPLDVTSAPDVLDNHAHKLVGIYPTPAQAIQAAESFARAWSKGFKSTAAAKCPCEDLDELEPRNDVEQGPFPRFGAS